MTNILITGASQGIGRATAIEAAKKRNHLLVSITAKTQMQLRVVWKP